MTRHRNGGEPDTTEAFLGTGWQYPVDADDRGRVRLSSGERDVEEAVRVVLGTAKGERVMRPTFGCGVHDLAFETMNATTLAEAERAVREALDRWEPRIDVESVTASADEVDRGRLLVRIDYRVRSTNAEANLVYPFYLQEGRGAE